MHTMTKKTDLRLTQTFFFIFVIGGFLIGMYLIHHLNIKDFSAGPTFIFCLAVCTLGAVIMAFFMANDLSRLTAGHALDINRIAEGTLLSVIRVISHKGKRFALVQQESLDPLTMNFVDVGKPALIDLDKFSGSLAPDQRYVSMKGDDGKIVLRKHPLTVTLVNSPIFGQVATDLDQSPSGTA